MTDIVLAITPDTAQVRSALESIFTGCRVWVTTDWGLLGPESDVIVVVTANQSEFPCGLSIMAQLKPQAGREIWLCGLAKALSDQLEARVCCDGTRVGESGSPYCSLIWDKGSPYLADDFETMLGDGEGGPLRVIRRLEPQSLSIPSASELGEWLLAATRIPVMVQNLPDPEKITMESKRVWVATIGLAGVAEALDVVVGEADPFVFTSDKSAEGRRLALLELKKLSRLAEERAPRGGVWRSLIRARAQLGLPPDENLAAGYRGALLRVGIVSGED